MSEAQSPEATATIRFIGQEMENFEVPVNILVSVLSGLQQIIYLLAVAQERRPVAPQRFRVPTDMQQLYSLRASIPQPGSYAIPLSLKPEIDNLSIDNQQQVKSNLEQTIQNLEKIFSSLDSSNFEQTQDVLPDSKLRNRILRETRKFLPKADEQWQLSFSRSGSNTRELILSNKVICNIENWLNQDAPEDAVMTVTGELIRIDFDKHLIVLRYPPTHQEIDCIYLEELEDLMIENRRQRLQVTGKFTLNADGHPIKLTDVTRIEPVDLSPITIREIPKQDKKLCFKTPLVLTPKLDEETEQLLVIEEPQIGLHVFAYSRDEITHEINDQLLMMWDEYVNVSPNELALDAGQLREKLLNKIEEVDNATEKR
jgi:hypothetical protein